MEPIYIIRDKSQLQGTCYIELLPGAFASQFWNDDSLFFTEEVFGLIEPIIERHTPQYDHYSCTDIRRSVWDRIIADLEQLAEQAEAATQIGDIRSDVRFFFNTTEAEFANEFRTNADALTRVSRELISWVREKLKEHECISILGM